MLLKIQMQNESREDDFKCLDDLKGLLEVLINLHKEPSRSWSVPVKDFSKASTTLL